jgi:hypothetical protein
MHTDECPANDTKCYISKVKEWTDAEDKVILNMAQRGMAHETIAGCMGRIPFELNTRFKQLAIRFYNAGQTDPSRLSKLTGLPLDQIESVIGNITFSEECEHCWNHGDVHESECPRNNIQYYLSSKKPSSVARRHGCEWTDSEEELILKMVGNGRSYEDIAKRVDRTLAAITARFILIASQCYMSGQHDPVLLCKLTGLPSDKIKAIINENQPKEIIKPTSITFEQGETIIELLKELKQMLTKPVPVRPGFLADASHGAK